MNKLWLNMMFHAVEGSAVMVEALLYSSIIMFLGVATTLGVVFWGFQYWVIPAMFSGVLFFFSLLETGDPMAPGSTWNAQFYGIKQPEATKAQKAFVVTVIVSITTIISVLICMYGGL